jgi:hypothetical protein
MTTPSGLYLSKSMDKNWGLYLINQNAEKYWALKSAVFSLLKVLNPFIQSDSDTQHQRWEQELIIEEGKTFNSSFLFIEFWIDNQSLILEKSLEFASQIHMELLLETV